MDVVGKFFLAAGSGKYTKGSLKHTYKNIKPVSEEETKKLKSYIKNSVSEDFKKS